MTIRSVIVFLVCVSLTAVAEARQGREGEPFRGGEGIVGSWLETTTVTGGPIFNGLVTFNADGTLVSSYQGNVNTGGPLPTSFTASHGQWVHDGGRTYSTTSVQLVSDFFGNLLFVNTLRQRITISKSRDRYRSVVRAEFQDPAGHLLFASEGSTEGLRVHVKPLW
jgi:hypothetical protein